MKVMYLITHRDMLNAINDYNTDKNNNLELILTNVNLMTKCSNEGFYLDGDLDLPYETTNDYLRIRDIYYQHLTIDWYRLWYDSYIRNRIIVIEGDNIPNSYVMFHNKIVGMPGFKLVDVTERFVSRDDSILLDTVDIDDMLNEQVNYITNLTLDYMEGPSTQYIVQLLGDPKFNVLPITFIFMYSLALRTFQYDVNYIHLIPYLYNMVLTVIYTKQYKFTSQSRESLDKAYNTALTYIARLPNPNLNILTQIDQLSEYIEHYPESLSVQSDCMDLVMSIMQLGKNHKSLLGVWKGISSSNKIGSESAFGNVFTVDILDRLKVLVKTSQHSGHLVNDEMVQTHETYIGLRLNELRTIIPNFMYCYGMNHMSPPYARLTSIKDDRSNEVVLWDDTDIGAPVPNIFLEYIDDSLSLGSTFDSFVRGKDRGINTARRLSSGESGICLLTQLALALHTAYTKLGFMHNDLHGNNILVRKLQTPMWIEYKYKNRSIYVYTMHMIMIIDYGMSSIKHDRSYVHSPAIAYNYGRGNPLADILKTYMGVLSRYAINPSEYSILFNIFSQAFGTDNVPIDVTKTQIDLFTRMTPSYQYIPPGKTPGLELHEDKFFDALINAYVKIQPQDLHEDVLNTNIPRILIPEDKFHMNDLQDVILWDWIVKNDVLDNVVEQMSPDISIQVTSDMNKIYNNITDDCEIRDRTRIIAASAIKDNTLTNCLNSIPDHILSKNQISLFNIAHIADILSAYKYAVTLCGDKTISERLCNVIPLLTHTLQRINLPKFIRDYKSIYYYLNKDNVHTLNNTIFRNKPVILSNYDQDVIELFKNTDVAKSFVLNNFHAIKLFK